jgi:hypothetical protein
VSTGDSKSTNLITLRKYQPSRVQGVINKTCIFFKKNKKTKQSSKSSNKGENNITCHHLVEKDLLLVKKLWTRRWRDSFPQPSLCGTFLLAFARCFLLVA